MAAAGKVHDDVRWAVDPLRLMQRVADQALAIVAHADGVLIGLMNGRDSVQHVCGSGRLSGYVGRRLALDGSLAGSAIRSRMTLVTEDTETDPRVNRDATRAYRVRSSVCVPLRRGEEEVGVLTVSSGRPEAFGARDVTLLDGLADFVSAFIGAATDFGRITERLLPAPDQGAGAGPRRELETAGWFIAHVLDPAAADDEAADREWVARILDERAFSMVFQPIFDINRGEMVAVEALARFTTPDRTPPDVVVAAAHNAGLGLELELALIAEALAYQGMLPPGVLLTVNAGPGTIASHRTISALAGADPARLAVELTEQTAVDDYPRLGDSLMALRELGVRLAIDDTGAGFASLMHILKLAPDFIKLDRQLTTGIDGDAVRSSLASALVRFAHETSTTIIAEGIETAAELNILRELGITHGQGYHLSRPVALTQLRAAAEQGAQRITQPVGELRQLRRR